MSKLLLIDPQNDFCDLPEDRLSGGNRPALPVAGAHADMLRTAAFIEAAGPALQSIVVTLDTHPRVAIERTTFWVDEAGAPVAPFTSITAQQVRQGLYRPVAPELVDPGLSGLDLRSWVIERLEQLEAAGRYTLMAWPVHCVAGTWGAAIHEDVDRALLKWERSSGQVVRKAPKGEYPLAEHYGVFEAEVPLQSVASTCFNTELAAKLDGPVLYVAGEALSHCVAASVEQLLRYRQGRGDGLVLLTDCMSPVAGFEDAARAFLERSRAAGAQLMTSEQALQQLKG